jgi:hypothetical protein
MPYDRITPATLANLGAVATLPLDTEDSNVLGAVDRQTREFIYDFLSSVFDANGDLLATSINVATTLAGAVNGSTANTAGVQQQIVQGTVSTPDIRVAAITSALIAAGAVTTGCLADGSVTTAKLAALAVTSAQIANATITEAQMAASSIGSAELINSCVTAIKIADGVVGTTQLAALSVTAAKIANSTITEAQMAPLSVGTTELIALSVTTAKLALGAVTAAQIAAATITAANMAPLSVGASQLVLACVTAAQIANTTITEAQMALLSVGTPELIAKCVTTAKINDGAVGATQLGANVVGVGQLAPGTAAGQLLVSGTTSPFNLALVKPSGDITMDGTGLFTLTGKGIAVLQEQPSNGVAGGAGVANTWNVRGVTNPYTKIVDTATPTFITSVTSGKIVLTPGSYLFDGSAPAYAVVGHQTRINHFNSTGSIAVLHGTTENSPVAAAVMTKSVFTSVVVIAAGDYVQIEHFINTHTNANDFGIAAAADGAVYEVYAQIRIEKLS